MLNRYLTMIQVQRQDFNGRVLTIRASDLQALAAILGHGSRRGGSPLGRPRSELYALTYWGRRKICPGWIRSGLSPTTS